MLIGPFGHGLSKLRMTYLGQEPSCVGLSDLSVPILSFIRPIKLVRRPRAGPMSLSTHSCSLGSSLEVFDIIPRATLKLTSLAVSKQGLRL